MNEAMQRHQESNSDAQYVRAAGVAGLFVALTGLVINLIFESGGPAPNTSVSDVVAYLREHAQGLRIGNGLRSAVTALLPVFAVGVYVWIGPAGGPWRLVGLLGLSTVPVLGLAANSAGSIAFWRIESLSEQPELATMLWSITVVYFFALYVPYSVGVVGFSLAGRASARMPKWLWILGLAFGSIGLASVLAINLVVADDRIAGAALSAYLLFLVWLVGVSVVMLRTRGFLPATASASQPNSGD